MHARRHENSERIRNPEPEVCGRRMRGNAWDGRMGADATRPYSFMTKWIWREISWKPMEG